MSNTVGSAMGKRLKAIQQFALFQSSIDGTLGIDATHIETGEKLQFNAAELFLMCSTYKLPIAIIFLQHVASKKINLPDLVTVTDNDLRPPATSTLHQLDYSYPLKISIYNLLKLMLQESCNTSSDILLRKLGGPALVAACLSKLGIEDLRIDRYTLELIADSEGVKNLPPDHQISLRQYEEAAKLVSSEDLLKARAKFKTDIRDTTTPAAMTGLLIKLFKEELIDAEHTNLLLKIMSGCKRGQLRLKGLLPQGTFIAHKTGTAAGYTHNVGVIALPHQSGHIAISAYIKATPDLARHERVLAEVGRTVYDYFLFMD